MEYKVLARYVVRKVAAVVKQLESGEVRHQLRHEEGFSCSISEMGGAGSWQSAHSHRRVSEIRIVQRGWCALATLDVSGKLQLCRYGAWSTFMVRPDVPHNVFLPRGAIIICSKFGEPTNLTEDWVAHRLLDELCQGIDEATLLQLEVNT